ncbi:MAG: serine/threonine-protein kinase [Candidatus Theseobacter exili]|nr:serine/threonine-protein kinase [Candidatus Theseobacter exili]
MKIPEHLNWQATGKTLGGGGQATIYEVTSKDNTDSTTYAMKILSKKKPQKAYERFVREIEAIKSLDHEYIIKIIDHSNIDDDFHYYVMEYIEGAISLKKLIGSEKNPFYKSILESINFFQKILSALSCLENSGLVHRDLSLGNILFMPNKAIKIIDFGLCQTDEHETITLCDEGIGTQNYMAPECEAGAEGKISIYSDIYSAGKILWSVITNRNAFARESSVFNNNSMKSIFPDNPECWHLHHIFKKTIRHNTADRWQDAKSAMSASSYIYYVISSGFPPLEIIDSHCPICGYGNINTFDTSHMVFGNPNPRGITGLKCDNCGHCMAIDNMVLDGNLNKRNELS